MSKFAWAEYKIKYFASLIEYTQVSIFIYSIYLHWLFSMFTDTNISKSANETFRKRLHNTYNISIKIS